MNIIEKVICVKKAANHDHLTIGKEYTIELIGINKDMWITGDDGISYSYRYPNVKFKNVKDIRNKAIDNILK